MKKLTISILLLFSLIIMTSCGETHTHEFKEKERVEATCTTKGKVVYECDCGQVKEEILEIIDHTFKVIEGKEATCTEEGYIAYQQCTVCNFSETKKTIPALGHAYDTKTVLPTCTEEGYDEHVCRRCSDRYKDNIQAAASHDYVKHDGKAATCEEVGYEEYFTCNNCEYSSYKEIPALGHDLNYHNEQAATCTDKGFKKYEDCNRCEYTTYEEIQPTGHNYSYVYYEPSCLTGGYKKYTCSNCQDTYTETVSDPLGHDCINMPKVESTCTTVGNEAYEYCQNCNYTTYVEIPMKPHTPSNEYIEVEQGHRTYCSYCGFEYEIEPHNIVNGLCEKCGYNDTTQYLTIIYDEENKQYILVDCVETAKYVYIPNYVNVIQEYAFDSCEDLVYVNIPNSVVEIQYGAFINCDSLKELTIPGSVEVIKPLNASYVETLILEEGVKEIVDNCFSNYPPKVVYLPKSIEKIGINNFEDEHNYHVKHATIYYAGDLYDWIEIEHMEYTAISSVDFYIKNSETGKYELPKEFIIPSDMINVDTKALAGIKSLESIVFHDNVKSVGRLSLANLPNIKKITLNEGIETIEDYAFADCLLLEEMNFPSSLKSIGLAAIYNTNFTKIKLPFIGGGRYIRPYFSYIFGVESNWIYPNEFDHVFEEVIIYDSTEIMGAGFYNCTGIKNIIFEKDITNVENPDYALSNLSSLENNVYDNGIYIGSKDNPYQIFVKPINDEVKELTIYKDVKYFVYNELAALDGVIEKLSIPFIGYYYGDETGHFSKLFNKNTNKEISPVLKELTISGNADDVNVTYSNIEKLIIEDCRKLSQFKFSPNLHTVVLPEGVEKIAFYAFEDCKNLKYINLPSSLKKIDQNAFLNCTSLEEIEIPGENTIIGSNVFKNCESLKKLTVPYISAENADNENFYGILNYMNKEVANNLEELTVLYEANVIGGLKECTSLKKLTIPYVGNNDNYSHLGYVFNAESYLEQNIFVPSTLKEIIVIDGSSIKENSFYGLVNIEKILIKENIVNLPENALTGCTNLVFKELNGALYLSSLTNDYAILVGFADGEIESFEFNSSTEAVYKSAFENVIINELIIKVSKANLLSIFNIEELNVLKIIGDEENSVLKHPLGNTISSIDTLEIEGITEIVSDVFKNSTMVNTFIYNGTLEEWQEIQFENIYSTPAIIAEEVSINGEILTEIDLSNIVIEKEYIFAGWKNITSIILNENSQFTSTTFEGCLNISEYKGSVSMLKLLPIDQIKSITFMNDYTTLDQDDLCGITDLDYFSIDKNIYYIHNDTFSNVERIGKFNFIGTIKEWNEVRFDREESNPTYFSHNIYFNDVLISNIDFEEEGIEQIESLHFANVKNITLIDLSGVSNIYAKAFMNSGLTSLVLPDNYIDIAYEAFTGSDIVTFDTGDYLESLPNEILYGCLSLNSIHIGKNLKSYNNQVLLGSRITTVTVDPENTRFSVEDNCLVGYEDLYEIIDGSLETTGAKVKTVYLVGSIDGSIPNDVENIYSYAYSTCNDVNVITIPTNVKYIDNYIFDNCHELEKIVLQHTNYSSTYGFSISASAYFTSNPGHLPTSFREYEVLGGDEITGYFFSDCSYVQTFTLPNTITKIGSSAFSGCINIKEFDFTNITEIGSKAFKDCTGLASVIIPETCTMISTECFSGCTNLKEMTVPSLPNGMMGAYFSMYDNNNPDEYFANQEWGRYYVPNSLSKITYTGDTIYNYAFKGLKSIKELHFTSDISVVGSHAMSDCDNLEIVVFEGDVVKMLDSIFSNSNKLSKIIIKGAITGDVDANVFKDYSAIEIIVIQNGCDGSVIKLVDDIKTEFFYICSYNYAGCTGWTGNITEERRYLHKDVGRYFGWYFDTDGFTPIIF